MIVKVCGVCTAAIADVAVEAGADWVGIMFEPRSVRYAGDDAARAVRDAVGMRADCIGVFVAPSLQEIDDAADRYRLAAVQVHGSVDPALAVASSVPVIPGINIGGEHGAYTMQWWPDCLVLIDAPAGPLPGGTGVALPLDVAANVARHRPVILAGGLQPQTVADAVRAVRPRGVDASSGLERAPGVKDADLVAAFVRNARAADATSVVA
ncbi:MAG: phosphoribosylanthranilate isomerase [Candidatus Dormibacteria bacterium]